MKKQTILFFTQRFKAIQKTYINDDNTKKDGFITAIEEAIVDYFDQYGYENCFLKSTIKNNNCIDLLYQGNVRIDHINELKNIINEVFNEMHNVGVYKETSINVSID